MINKYSKDVIYYYLIGKILCLTESTSSQDTALSLSSPEGGHDTTEEEYDPSPEMMLPSPFILPPLSDTRLV